MFRPDRIIALDIGASKVVVAEFVTARSGAPELVKYGIGRLDAEGENEFESSACVVATIREVMQEYGIKPGSLLMTLSGQTVFPRYVKLPRVASDKVHQIVQYEAQQNVPFPIDEVVWDYQLLGETADGEMNVILVAVKIDNVTQLTDCVEAAGMEPEIVDVAPMALYNTVRYNYPGLEGCALVLDMGARSTNLIFMEEERVFSRSIPVAGNAITQAIMKEFEISFAAAEDLKHEHAMVALGGVYAEPEDETGARVSKVVRNVFARLHAEINRSINFYRSQQGGSAPSVVLLTGGSSVIPHCDTFFQEKLNVAVEYLNPFTRIAVQAGLDADRVGGDVHLLGEVAGLALRRSLDCPIQINLMPPDLVARKVFRRRQPFFILAAVALALMLLCWWMFSFRMHKLRGTQMDLVNGKVVNLQTIAAELDEVKSQRAEVHAKVDDINTLIGMRTRWAEMLNSIQGSMSPGMWMTSLTPIQSDEGVVSNVTLTALIFKDNFEMDPQVIDDFVEDGLRRAEFFTDDTELVNKRPDRDYAWSFEVRLALEDPIEMR